MFFKHFFALGVNQYTIDEHYDELVQIFHKDLVYRIHKVDRGLSQAKRHNHILVQAIPQNEGSFQNVTLLYL
jgi:hypothetical protein